MSNDNYPAGVTDAHPHFNASEVSMEVECCADEALVIPSFAIKAHLNDMHHYIENLVKLGHTPGNSILTSIAERLDQMQGQIDEMEREGEYECGWKGEQELALSEEAEWDCPRCGNTRSTDTLPEDRDPDEGWDSRYDD